MKKSTWIIIAVVAVIVIWVISAYNGMVQLDESVNTAWSQVENQYQRRADLIPNLVNTVKGYAEHESTTLEAVVAARNTASSIKIDPSKMTPEQFAEYQKAQNEVGGAIGRLLAVAESYPDLKANQNFLELQEQLEGTENRIQYARREYNEGVQVYNTMVRRFPNNIIANIFGFDKMSKFGAAEGADVAPTVEF